MRHTSQSVEFECCPETCITVSLPRHLSTPAPLVAPLEAWAESRRPRVVLGDGPQNLRWGTAHACVPPIFGEVVLSQVRTEKNRQEKSDMYVLYIINEIYEIMSEKRSSEIFGVKM